MPSYKAPVADFEFLMFDVLEIEKHTDLNGYADHLAYHWNCGTADR